MLQLQCEAIGKTDFKTFHDPKQYSFILSNFITPICDSINISINRPVILP